MQRIKSFVPFVLLLLTVISIGLATLVEEFWGTRTAQETIYHALWFQCLWGAVVLFGSIILYRFRQALNWASWGLHLAFVLILCGALTTSLTSQKGMLHLRTGETMNRFLTEDGRLLPLPFTAQLNSFRIVYYPGTEAPMDYVSELSCLKDGSKVAEGSISMNRIMQVEGYRLYQSSYDEDRQGSWLSVNYDPYGTPLTYAGYAWLALSMIAILFHRRSELRTLLSHPLLKRSGILGLFLLTSLFIQAEPLKVVNRQQADSMGYKQVIYNDRVMPLNTLARDFTQKLYGKPSYKNLSAEQVLMGWMIYPSEWQKEPMIKMKSEELKAELGIQGSYCTLEDLFNTDGTYRLQALWEREMGSNSKLTKSIQEMDEKVGLILMLTEGTLVQPLPEDGSVQRLSGMRVQAEVLYNKANFSKILFMVNLTLGFLCFFVFLYRLLNKTPGSYINDKPFRVLIWPITLIMLLAYVLRWYIAGRIPLSNGYETMQFIALSVLVITCALYRKLPYILSFGYILSGFTLLVAYLGQMNPQITPLMPVLNSPWLSSHVSLIMFSYALFAFTALNAILALCLKNREQVVLLTVISRILLYPATFCLGVGIFLGAVWANVSWGSYWSWDPKESWALVSFLLYGMVFHKKSLPITRNITVFHWYMLLCFASILMTYFGVNYLLGGMHSYSGA